MAESLEHPFFALTLQSFDVGSSFEARPTHLLNPHNFYVLPLAHQNLAYEIQRPGGMYQKEDLKVNKIVIYFCQGLNGYVRGTIQHIAEDGKCTIFALDNGFVEKNVGVERIFHPVHDAALYTPGLARQCELDMCMPINDEFAQDALEAFRHYVGNEKLHLIVRGMNGEKMRVIVYNSNPEDVATLLSMTQHTAIVAPNARLNESWQLTLDWKHHELEEDQTLHVRVQYGSSLSGFFVCTQGDYRDYLKNRVAFSSYCRSEPQIPYKYFVRGKPVGVMEHDGEPFERAIIVDVINVGYRAKVKLIDWGREFITTIEKVRLIRSEVFFTTPARALYCSAPNSKPWDNGLPTFLYKGFALAITVKRAGRELDIPHIVSLSPVPHN